MKRNLRSAASLLLAAVLALGTFATGASVSADDTATKSAPTLITAAAPTDPTTIDRIIVNMRDEDVFSESMAVHVHTPTQIEPDPYTGGKYSFSAEQKAIELEYAENKRQPDWRAMIRFNSKNILTADYKYMVLVYNVKTTGTYRLTLWNSPGAGPEYVIAEKGTDTKGFVVAEPYDISAANDAGSIQARWIAGNINTLGIESTDKNLRFYVREIGFFKSAADAKAYYGAVDIEDDPPIFDPDVVDEANLPAPVVMKFGKNGLESMMLGTGFFTNDAGEQGKYKHIAEGDRYVLKLEYSPSAKWDAYRFMPRFEIANTITNQHKYMRIVYKTTDTDANSIKLYNNSGTGTYTLVDNTAESHGNWIVSDVTNISTSQIIERLTGGKHCTLTYTSDSPDSEIYIKELAFFASLKQAGEYYGDVATIYESMTFGPRGNAGFFSGENYGVYEVNSEDATLDISYAESTNMRVHYLSKINFKEIGGMSNEYKYLRVYYSAKNPEGASGVKMYLYNDGGDGQVYVSNNLKDTNGEFVLSKTVLVPEGLMTRLTGIGGKNTKPMHASLCIDANGTGGLYRIKGLYFFTSKASADAFEIKEVNSAITINGNPISDYRIVVSEDAGDQVYLAANLLVSRIKTLCGVSLEIVTDDIAPVSKEILIGQTNRALSSSLYAKLNSYDKYNAALDGDTLAINAAIAANLSDAVTAYMRNYLYLGLDNPESIAITSADALDGNTTYMKRYDKWKPVTNVANPEIFTDSFDSDNGYWTEEENTSDWKLDGGVYKTTADDLALSYIHVYEKNVKFGVKMMYTAAGKNGNMGLMLRYAAEDAYIKAGYDFEKGEWYIDEREGNDFHIFRKASAKATLTPNTWYDLVFTVDGTKATLTVNGAAVLTASVSHTSPGRIAVYAEDASVAVDDADIALLSGQGTILKNVTHMKVDIGKYVEGGSAWELSDGTVLFEHAYVAYKSTDKGYTWEKTDKQMGIGHYPSILRLNDGSLLSVGDHDKKDGKISISAKISNDDGKTWTKVGDVCYRWYHVDGKETTAGAGNMNDKLFQSATTGRIFYGQNYESQAGPVNGRTVFCEFYYSDDNGRTWTKAETDSWELPGNETQTHFGECKMLECADGSIRMYNSWNPTGNIQYSESFDNGVTWGPLTPLEGFKCTQSSMQFVRDPYAENGTTYYMIWINAERFADLASSAPRSRLSLAKSTDGKNWTVMGDIWRFEGNYLAPNSKAFITQIVDPFIQVTDETIIVGTGISEQIGLVSAGDNGFHQAQREQIWTIDKKANDPGEKLGSFTDVTTKHDFYDAVKFVTEKGLFNGTSATTFSPSTTMTRSMFVTVLGRLDGADMSKYTTPTFKDVVAGQWYTSYVEWAAANNIVNGIGNGLYGIDGAVTVEQICLMLSRYNGAKAAATASGKTVADFTDASSISAWAADGVKWAVENGVYAGQGGKLNPTAPASRALVATMFHNYVNVYGK